MSDFNDRGGHGQGEWERDVLNRLAFATLNEQRRARRWSIFFKSLLFVYLFAVLFLLILPDDFGTGRVGEHAALVDIDGVISDTGQASADNIISGLRAAFRDANTKGVILRINSPGGSPVQSGYVNDEIWRLRQQYPETPVYAVITDIGASGAYYIAAAADEIYADKASIVGSIGVVMNTFGFVEALDKLGIERRLMAAGENKGFLDPFSPLDSDEVEHVTAMLDTIHRQFIRVVQEGRGDRLTDEVNVFSGLVWTGEESVRLGLVDGLASSGQVAREVIGVDTVVDFTPRPHFLDLFADTLGVTLGRAVQTLLRTEAVSLR